MTKNPVTVQVMGITLITQCSPIALTLTIFHTNSHQLQPTSFFMKGAFNAQYVATSPKSTFDSIASECHSCCTIYSQRIEQLEATIQEMQRKLVSSTSSKCWVFFPTRCQIVTFSLGIEAVLKKKIGLSSPNNLF